jgi:hypothetical protein
MNDDWIRHIDYHLDLENLLFVQGLIEKQGIELKFVFGSLSKSTAFMPAAWKKIKPVITLSSSGYDYDEDRIAVLGHEFGHILSWQNGGHTTEFYLAKDRYKIVNKLDALILALNRFKRFFLIGIFIRFLQWEIDKLLAKCMPAIIIEEERAWEFGFAWLSQHGILASTQMQRIRNHYLDTYRRMIPCKKTKTLKSEASTAAPAENDIASPK